MYSYNIKAQPFFETGLKKRLLEENKDLDHVYIESFKYLYKYAGKEDLIGIRVSGNIKIKLPIVFQDMVDISDTLFFRAFTGKEFILDSPDFEDMEEEEESRPVWVFPTAGEKYHEEDCSYINVAAKQALLNSSIKAKYKPCSHCDPGGLEPGSVIYYFESSGGVYHKGSCFIVDRYVISMELKDAEKKGYGPCSKCI
jgi:hypothetical protein